MTTPWNEQLADEIDKVIVRTLFVGATVVLGVVLAAVDIFHRHNDKLSRRR